MAAMSQYETSQFPLLMLMFVFESSVAENLSEYR